MKNVGLGHVASSGQYEDGQPVADQARDPDCQDGDALEPKAANRNRRFVLARPRAASLVAHVRFFKRKINFVHSLNLN